MPSERAAFFAKKCYERFILAFVQEVENRFGVYVQLVVTNYK